MKEVNFKIVEIPTHQVLLTKDFDEDNDDQPLMVVSFFIDGMKVSMKLGYKTEDIRNQMFDEFGETNAQGIVDKIISQFNS